MHTSRFQLPLSPAALFGRASKPNKLEGEQVSGLNRWDLMQERYHVHSSSKCNAIIGRKRNEIDMVDFGALTVRYDIG